MVEVHDDSSLSGDEFVATYYGDLTVYLWREDTVSATEEEARARSADVGASVERPEAAAGHLSGAVKSFFILRVALGMILGLSIITFFVFSIRFGSPSGGVSAIGFLSPVIIGVTVYALGGYVLYRLARLAITWIRKRNT